jgi:hypothetical protein
MRLTTLVMVVALWSCGKDDKKPSEQPATKPATTAVKADRGNYRDVQSIDELEVEVPPDAKPMERIPGFQNADKTFAFAIKTLGSDLEHKDPAAFKASMKYGVKDWLKEELLEDGGWYVTHTTDMGGPPAYSLQMRRKIGDTWYKCTCIVPKEENLEPVIKACKSLRKKA